MFAPPRPALTGNPLQAVTDHDAYEISLPFVNDLSAYRALFEAYPNIANAMDYATLPADYQEALWAEIDAAETLGYAHADPPDGYSDTPPYTWDKEVPRAEAIVFYGVKVAHALKHEIARTFPWRLTSYSEEELRSLLDPEELFEFWSYVGSTYNAKWSFSVDHSPYDCYGFVGPVVASASSAVGAISNILLSIGEQYRHSGGGDTVESGTSPKDSWNGQRIAWNGCSYASSFSRAWMRSVNIPAQGLVGWWGGTTHHTTTYPGTGTDGVGSVLVHADDLYNSNFNQWSFDRLMSMDYWNTNVFIYDPYPSTENTTERQYHTTAPSYKKQMLRPSDTALTNFASSSYGFPVTLETYRFLFDIYDEQALVDQHYDDLVSITGEAGLGTEGGLYGKRNEDNTGPTLPVTETTSGDIHLSTPGEQWSYNNHSGGTIYIEADNVEVSHCIIDGGGLYKGIIVDDDLTGVQIQRCEIFDCATVAIEGAPLLIERCHIHDNEQSALWVTGTTGSGAGGLWGTGHTYVNKNYIVDNGTVSPGYGSVTAGATTPIILRLNTIKMGATDTAAVASSASVSKLLVDWNWLDGGVYTVKSIDTTEGLHITNNLFGRNAGTGLCLETNTIGTWARNRYEDDLSPALITDTAPL